MPAILGAVFAGLAVILGAFGAHALSGNLSDSDMQTFRTAVQYQFLHAIGMILTNFSKRLELAGWIFLAGIIVFSGSLYLIVASGIKTFGMVTPIGGILFISGWTIFGYQLWKERQNASED
ncbi:MAG: DUF423 domain-containing protein [Candidatus Marinimicrobia bacterium]|nr:DUF423 domain-containing protein [Candidatus Neomarinimicrobiota bacterium]